MIGTTLAFKLLGGVTGASLLATGALFMLNKDKAADLREAKHELTTLQSTIEQQAAHITLLETAALERLADNESLSEQEQELTDALEIQDPADRRRAFGCAVMRQQFESGTRDSLPADCRPPDEA